MVYVSFDGKSYDGSKVADRFQRMLVELTGALNYKEIQQVNGETEIVKMNAKKKYKISEVDLSATINTDTRYEGLDVNIIRRPKRWVNAYFSFVAAALPSLVSLAAEPLIGTYNSLGLFAGSLLYAAIMGPISYLHFDSVKPLSHKLNKQDLFVRKLAENFKNKLST